MGRNRGQTTLGSLRAIYTEGGGGASGILSFWAGTGPKVRHIHHMINNTYKFLQLQTLLLSTNICVGPQLSVCRLLYRCSKAQQRELSSCTPRRPS